MNNTKVFLLAAAAWVALTMTLAVGFYFYTYNTGMGQMKIALADMQTLVYDSKMGKDLSKELNNISEEFGKEYQDAAKTLNDMQEELKNRKSLMSDEEYTDSQVNILSAQNQLGMLVRNFQNSVLGKLTELSKHISVKVNDLLPNLMKKFGFDILFSSESMIYFNDDMDFMMDITDDVMKKLDATSPESPLDLSDYVQKWKDEIRNLLQKAKEGKFRENTQKEGK